MLIHILSGQPNERCRQFFNAHWPQANEQLFGWTNQERWDKEYITLWLEEQEM